MSWGCERSREGTQCLIYPPLRAVFLGTRPPRVPAGFCGCAGPSLLPGFLLSCGELGVGRLAALPSCCGDFCCCGAQALRCQAQQLWGTGLSTACGIFPTDRTCVPGIAGEFLTKGSPWSVVFNLFGLWTSYLHS